MPTDLIRYDLLVQDALRSVVRKVLTDAAKSGLPGEHHFNIAFKTQAPGVVVPAAVKQRFPEEMSIILQHEFWDLVVTPDGFEVNLNFSRKPERLTVPFDAITGFTDPSVPFGFKLEPRVAEEARPAAPAPARLSSAPGPAKAAAKPGEPGAQGGTASHGKAEPARPEPAKAGGSAKSDAKAEAPTKGEAAKVVSIDAFRKK